MGGKRDAKLFLWSGLFAAIAILGLTRSIFKLQGLFFIGEFVLLLFFGSIALLSLISIYSGFKLGFGFLSAVFGLILIDLLFIYFKTKPMDLAYLATIVSSSIGFVMTVANINEKEDIIEDFEELEPIKEPEVVKEPEYAEEAPQEAPEEVQEEVSEEPQEEVVEEEPEEETGPFISGKVIASKAGKLYHSTKCDWGDLIKEENLVEYNTKAEAEEDGLKPHSCME